MSADCGATQPTAGVDAPGVGLPDSVLTVMRGLNTDGRFIVDGACTAPSTYQESMLHKDVTDCPVGIPNLMGVGGKVCEVTKVGTHKLNLKHDRGVWSADIKRLRLSRNLGVNLIPESTLVEELGCDLRWDHGGAGKILRTPDGGECLLRFEDGLHFLEHDAEEMDYAALATLDQRVHVRGDAEGCGSTDKVYNLLVNEAKVLDGAMATEYANRHIQATIDDEVTERMRSMHELLGHPGARALQGALETAGFELSEQELSALSHLHCDDCHVGKHVRRSVSKTAPTPKPERIGVKVSCDVVGKYDTAIGGYRYCWIFVDWYSRKPFVYPVQRKSEFLSAFQQYLLDAGLWKDGHPRLGLLQCDTSKEVFCAESKAFARKHGIRLRASPPGEQGMNSIIERLWRVLKSKMITILKSTGAPKKFWAYVLKHVATVVALTPMGATKDDTPFSRQFGYSPLLLGKDGKLPCPWGTTGTVTVWKGKGALDPPGRVGIYVGNSERSNTRLVWCPDTDAVVEAYSFRPSKNSNGTWVTGGKDVSKDYWHLPMLEDWDLPHDRDSDTTWDV